MGSKVHIDDTCNRWVPSGCTQSSTHCRNPLPDRCVPLCCTYSSAHRHNPLPDRWKFCKLIILLNNFGFIFFLKNFYRISQKNIITGKEVYNLFFIF